MKIEYEIVFSSINLIEIIEKIINLWWIKIKEKTLMKRIVFDSPYYWKWSYLRIRDEWDKITCTYKESKEWRLDITSVSELETEVKDFEVIVWIFRKLWLKEKSYQENYREVWEINNEIELMIDQWPGLKPYIEIEWENEEIVKKYTKLLWFDYTNWVFGSSFDVYEKELWIKFDDINNLKRITFENLEDIERLRGK